MKQPQRILIMGLPGSGKTYLAEQLKKYLKDHINPINEHSLKPIADARVTVAWLNADEVRRHFNDWDFSREGRIRQSLRMRDLADEANTDYCIVDFVAPLVEMRNNFKADWTIWVDTIDRGRFEDTNQVFVPPDVYDFRITEQNGEKWAEFIGQHIIDNQRRPTFDWQKETVQMLGRWQPWHAGDLDPIYQGQYEIQVVPNIVNITYGRDVGYVIEQESFDESITAISATTIRRSLGLE